MSFIDLNKKSKIDPRVDRMIEIGGQHASRFREMDDRFEIIDARLAGMLSSLMSTENDVKVLSDQLNHLINKNNETRNGLADAINTIANTVDIEANRRRSAFAEIRDEIPNLTTVDAALCAIDARLRVVEQPKKKSYATHIVVAVIVTWLMYLSCR